ncbi:AMP-dependent synthetase/ligase [Parasphingorhabdus pacifica]
MTASAQVSEALEQRAPSVGRMFLDRVAESSDREAFRYPRADGWESRTWSQVGARVSRIAAGLLSLGVAPEERVAIAASTRYEWIVADLAIMCAGAATTTVYPTTIASEVAYILADSGSAVVFAEDDEQIEKLRAQRDEIPEVRKVVTFDGTADDDWVITFEKLVELGERLLTEQPDVVDERVAATTSEQLATIIYTSGTTGRPKGVRLRHSAWTYEGTTATLQGQLSSSDLQYLWLPLAHAFGKVMLSNQLAVGFATAVDGRVDKIIENLAVVRPTFMAAAPRVFEKAHGRIQTTVDSEGGAKKKLFDWAFGVGKRAARARRAGERVPPLLAAANKIADRLVFTKIRDRFGGRVRFFVSGSAPLNKEIAEWFEAAGVLVLEGYGLTETAAGTTLNRPDNYKLGTIGQPLPGTEVSIAEDGEILVRGPGVMAGYHNMDEQTEDVLDSDGWMHTGDIGEMDADGFVAITDRKKDLFKTSNGKYVAPSSVEGRFKAVCPYASQFLVHGPGRNYCTALVTLDEEAITDWARRNGLGGRDYSEIVESDQVRELLQGYVDELNAGLNRWETIKRFIILPRELSVEHGELTPSLKVKRKVVEERNSDALESMYAD